MSLRRLVRAVENGGAVFRTKPQVWDVRRNTDARSAIIGQLSDLEFQALKSKGHLKQYGTLEPVRYVWSGPKLVQSTGARACLDGFLQASAPVSLLEKALRSLADRSEAHCLERASVWFTQDFKWAHCTATVSGMNWAALELGGRIDRSISAEKKDDPLYRIAAQRRMKKVERSFSAAANQELQALIIKRRTPRQFGTDFHYQIYRTTIRSIDLLRRLSWIYEKELDPPECIDLI